MADRKVYKKRDHFFFCAAVIDGSLVAEPIKAESEKEASTSFQEMYGTRPDVVKSGEGYGYSIYKATGNTSANRISITVDAKSLMTRTTKTFSGQFQGWNIVGSGLKKCEVDNVKYKDNELIAIECDSPIDEENKVSKPRLKKREVIHRDNIQNLAEMS